MSEIAKREHGAIDMTQGSPTRLIVAFSLPLLLGNVLQQLYNMVDSIVVGQFVGASALTAVGTGFPIIFLLASLFIGFAMGATSNAMANMQVVTKKYGPSPVAYFAIPMVGGMFIDFFNAVLIAANIGWWT